MSRLLVVEDDRRIGELVRGALAELGHEVSWVTDGASALRAAAAAEVDLVLLDLGLPDLDGLQVCRRVRRARPEAVIVILTARDDDMDVILGLEAGADDYVTKPFGTEVLQARVRAHLRRRAPRTDPGTLACGDLLLDGGARTCTLAGEQVALRAKQFDLLERLLRDAGRTVPREALMAEVWDPNWFGSTKTLDVHIASLRRQLDAVAARSGGRPPRIGTVRGVGYRVDPPDGH